MWRRFCGDHNSLFILSSMLSHFSFIHCSFANLHFLSISFLSRLYSDFPLSSIEFLCFLLSSINSNISSFIHFFLPFNFFSPITSPAVFITISFNVLHSYSLEWHGNSSLSSSSILSWNSTFSFVSLNLFKSHLFAFLRFWSFLNFNLHFIITRL